MQFKECSIDALEEQAYLLARRITYPSNILLWGEMGAGKTTFSKAFIRSYYNNNELSVPSPTFTLIQTYSARQLADQKVKGEIWHVDLYRITQAEEIEMLGLEEAMYNKLCLIEWPDRLNTVQVPNCVNVYLNVISENTRAFALQYG